jgi:hypothetical protein
VKKTVTPSWLGSVPYNFGEVAAGSLKADEWRSMATVYLPIALVISWGECSSHPSLEDATHFRRILDHTMALFQAVRLACLRTMTPARLTAYRVHIARYVRDLRSLHPDFNACPNHHMAQHIYDFLILFGPVRSWWSFPFERLIGVLQRLPINHKFGEYISKQLLPPR